MKEFHVTIYNDGRKVAKQDMTTDELSTFLSGLNCKPEEYEKLPDESEIMCSDGIAFLQPSQDMFIALRYVLNIA